MIFETPRILKESAQGFADRRILDEMFVERKIILLGEINSERANSLILQLLQLEAENPEAEIELMISSPGGEVQAGLSVYDVMKTIKCPVRTVCAGVAASMGAILFSAGDVREIYEHSKLMIHDPLLNNVGGNALKIKDVADDIMATRNTVAEILSEATGHPIEVILEKTAKDCYFIADEAVEFGLADRVIAAAKDKKDDIEEAPLSDAPF